MQKQSTTNSGLSASPDAHDFKRSARRAFADLTGGFPVYEPASDIDRIDELTAFLRVSHLSLSSDASLDQKDKDALMLLLQHTIDGLEGVASRMDKAQLGVNLFFSRYDDRHDTNADTGGAA